MDKIKLKAPATIANLSCGFDILGLCLNNPYDEIEVIKSNDTNIIIDSIDSPFSNIPTDPKENTGGIPALLIQKDLKLNFGFKIVIKKGIPLSSGLGSSAATAVGVVYGINQILGNVLTEEKMLMYALEGEKISSLTPHADNIGPCLKGGLILIKNTSPVDLIRLPIGPFTLVVLQPKIKIDTKMAREILPKKIDLSKAVKQWGNVSSLTYGFTVNDIDLIKKSMHDVIIEPVRAKLINGYNKLKNAALDSGAIGCSISGSGPSIFALCENDENADKTMLAMENKSKELKIKYNIYKSSINHSGPQIVR